MRPQDPVHFSPKLGAWVVSRYNQVVPDLRDARLAGETKEKGIKANLPSRRRERVRGRQPLLSRRKPALLNRLTLPCQWATPFSPPENGTSSYPTHKGDGFYRRLVSASPM
jgi:hypothetical protein